MSHPEPPPHEPLPDDPSRAPGVMDEAMWEASRRLAALPCNRDGADKSFVHGAIRMMHRFHRMPVEWVCIGDIPPGARTRDGALLPPEPEWRIPGHVERVPPTLLRPSAPAEALAPEDFSMDPYVVAWRALRRAGLPFLVIGAYAANLYLTRMGREIHTKDCDLLLPPEAEALRRTIAALASEGFAFHAGGEPLPAPDPVVLEGIVRAKACVHATLGSSEVDLVLAATGLDFHALWPRRVQLVVAGVAVHVAPLEDVLRSKEAVGRPKDKYFLELWREVLDEALQREARRRAGGRPEA